MNTQHTKSDIRLFHTMKTWNICHVFTKIFVWFMHMASKFITEWD